MGIKVSDATIPGIFFADDMVILGSDEIELQNLLDIVAEEGSKLDLKFNGRKSGVICSWKKKSYSYKWRLCQSVICKKDRVKAT